VKKDGNVKRKLLGILVSCFNILLAKTPWIGLANFFWISRKCRDIWQPDTHSISTRKQAATARVSSLLRHELDLHQASTTNWLSRCDFN
jgi:hypothetical protein